MGERGRTGGQQAALLLIAAGLLTVVNNYLPGAGHLDIAVLNAVGALALAIGAVSYVLPWHRWPSPASLVLAPVAFAMISTSNYLGGVGPYSYAVYFIVVFAWVGVAHPPRTSYWLAPLAAAAYVGPLVARDDVAPGAASSVTVAIPVCLLVAETIARTVRRLHDSRESLSAYASELERWHAHEQAVINAMPDGMAVLGPDGVVRSWNAAAEAMTGCAAGSTIGRQVPFPMPAAGDAAEVAVGERRWIEIAAAELVTTGETVLSFRDVTKQKLLDEAKDVFLATTSHELRTPLTVIKGFVSTLQLRFEQMPASLREEALRAVADRTESLIALVDHLLLGSRSGAGQQPLHRANVDMVEPLERLVHDIDASSPHRVTLTAAPDLPMVVADRGTIQPIVGQLLENAVKYSPDGGQIEVRAERHGDFVAVSVADRGVGIPDGDETRIFQRFYQAGSVDRRRFGGVGLGLSIVDGLVRAQGGATWARNREGGGAVVGFTLPIAADVPAPRPAEAADQLT